MLHVILLVSRIINRKLTFDSTVCSPMFSVRVTCSPGYFIDGTTGECTQCADGTYQPHPSEATLFLNNRSFGRHEDKEAIVGISMLKMNYSGGLWTFN